MKPKLILCLALVLSGKPKLILCLALVLSGGLFGCSSKQTSTNTSASLQNILRQIEQRVPELESTGISAGISSSSQVWPGEEYASAGFVLMKNPRYHPVGEFPREKSPVPYCDIYVTVTRFPSSGEVQKYIKNNLFGVARQASPERKGKKYKGAILYRYNSGFGHVVCQDGLYIIEIMPINEGASPLTMKVLDVLLAELGSN
ncbi:MAG TPA: hypothetical protein VMV89_10040 [Candidatus Paceibacterota bacterium]|nr:hypothetical protein [Candidatus Paceibacterota bacterium]